MAGFIFEKLGVVQILSERMHGYVWCVVRNLLEPKRVGFAFRREPVRVWNQSASVVSTIPVQSIAITQRLPIFWWLEHPGDEAIRWVYHCLQYWRRSRLRPKLLLKSFKGLRVGSVGMISLYYMDNYLMHLLRWAGLCSLSLSVFSAMRLFWLARVSGNTPLPSVDSTFG